jgi:hypothetical protein
MTGPQLPWLVRDKVRRAASVAVMVYVSAYLGLSLAGSYTADGLVLRWSPKWCSRVVGKEFCLERRGPTRLGVTFLPLLKTDQALWHRTTYPVVDCWLLDEAIAESSARSGTN